VCVGGNGELWRATAHEQSVIELKPGTTCDIPLGTYFQFRTTGNTPLEIVITTTPPWPGEREAVKVEGKWKPTV
jgi:mannose-6-phosphate isomerase-like protein (cupin superfamily)